MFLFLKCEISSVNHVAGVNVLRAIGSRDIWWQRRDLRVASLLSSKSARLIVA